MIPFNKPTISRKDLIGVLEAMISNNISDGEQTRKFEKKFAEYIGAKDSVMVNNVSSCLYLVFKLLELKEGDEVILSTYAEPYLLEVIYTFKLTPVFIDLKEGQYSLDLEKSKNAITEKTKVIILSHLFGYPLEFKKEDLIGNKEISLIEDCIHSLGSHINDVHTGLEGDFAVFSFSANRMITSGQGGAIICKNRNDLLKIKNYRENSFPTEILGRLDFSITDMQSAMAISELSLLKKFIERRKEIGKYFEECAFKGKNNFLKPADNVDYNFYCFAIQMNSSVKVAIEMFKKYKIIAKQPLERTLYELWNEDKANYPNTEKMYLKTLCVPLFPILKKREILEIGKLITNIR